ncbi:hypothetical protein ACEQPO_31375 [Bacillus sp. SL00103]
MSSTTSGTSRHGVCCFKKSESENSSSFKSGLHNGNGDAFRHTYWNAELATMLGSGVFLIRIMGKCMLKMD